MLAVRRALLTAARMATESAIIRNYSEFTQPGASRRALLSYLVWPLLVPQVYRDRVRFSNRGIAQEIPRALNELGYIVDIVHFRNIRCTVRSHYDLFIGHTGANFRYLSERLAPHTKTIYFATGLYWKALNVREAKRIYEFAARKGWLLPPDRAVIDDEEWANRRADGILYLGNKGVARTFEDCPNLAGVNNAAFPITWNGWKHKDFEAGRIHFLYFAGSGNLHKGLDRIIEAFVDTELHIHICQVIEPLFAKAYMPELWHNPRIHVYDFVKQRSEAYYNLVMGCNWFISATCAEGQPGAAIECMAHGLIPILPDEANIDLGDWAIRLENCEVDTIRTTILLASRTESSVCRIMADAVVREVEEHYSPEHFRTGFKLALQQLLQVSTSSS